MELTAVHVDCGEDLIEEGNPEELEPERVDELHWMIGADAHCLNLFQAIIMPLYTSFLPSLFPFNRKRISLSVTGI